MLKMNMFRTLRLVGGAQLKRLQNTGSTVPAAAAAAPTAEQPVAKPTKPPKSSGLVAAAFASLREEGDGRGSVKKVIEHLGKSDIGKEIDSAEDVPTLLSLADGQQLTREDSLKIISKLYDWSSKNKVQISEFESDGRFVNVCQILSSQQSKSKSKDYYPSKSEDLSTVLGVTGDDRAARLISTLSLPQMVKVMSNLAQKHRRSTPLLRSLSYNITQKTETIDIKKCADLFFAMATLSFPDPVLVERLCTDVQLSLSKNKEKSSVIGSIVTSLGLLKVKDAQLLDSILEWMLEHRNICRSQDVAAYVISAAILGHSASGIQNLPALLQPDFAKSSSYLDYVWSLMVLNIITENQVRSVLSPDFGESLKVEGEIPFSSLKKLCNINAYVTLFMKGYEGPLLLDNVFEPLQMSYSKEKQQYIGVLLDTLKSLLSSEANIQKNCDSKMGFLFDAYMVLDKNCTPYPVNTKDNAKGKRLTKLAFFGLDYHDLCKNTREPTGSILLYKKLLEEKGYKVLLVPYTEFNVSDKLMYRVQYIDNKIREVLRQ